MLPDRSQSYMFNIYFLHFFHPEKPFTRSWFLSSHSHFDNNSFVINYRVTFFVSLPFICHVICDNDFSSELFNAFHRAQRHTHTHRKEERERERGKVWGKPPLEHCFDLRLSSAIFRHRYTCIFHFRLSVAAFPFIFHIFYGAPSRHVCVCECKKWKLRLCLCFALLSFISFHFISLQFIFHVVAIRVVARLCFKAFRNPFRNYVSLFNIMLCSPLALAATATALALSLFLSLHCQYFRTMSSGCGCRTERTESLPGAWCLVPAGSRGSRWGQVWH